MPQMHLIQPVFTNSAWGPFTKNKKEYFKERKRKKERKKKFKETK